MLAIQKRRGGDRMKNREVLLEAKGLKKYFMVKKKLFSKQKSFVKAVDDISFQVYKGETVGIVGESGCGKSTTGRLLIRLLDATEGEVFYKGQNILNLPSEAMRDLRKELQIVFQDPYSSLNPRMTVGQIIAEPLINFGICEKEERNQKVNELLEVVGLAPYHKNRYPHEFSGGQRQRIGIARALAVNPQIIIADEPVSALDVSIQSQILNLLRRLQKQFQLTYIFISHDLNVVYHFCDRIIVMYLGRVVEISTKEALYKEPLHPYTQALLSAVPTTDQKQKKERIVLSGDVPSPANPPKGCAFHPRCFACMEICKEVRPELKEMSNGSFVACHLYND